MNPTDEFRTAFSEFAAYPYCTVTEACAPFTVIAF
jgi:hypothetical protein